MNIGIIGGGSIGLLFGAYIAEKNHQVTIYTRTKEQALDINQNGITKMFDGQSSVFAINATCILDGIATHDAVIVAVKQYHLADLENTLQTIPVSIPLLFIQNGMGHLSMLDNLPQHELIVGVVEHGALKKSGNMILHSGVGVTKLSTYRGDTKVLKALIDNLSSVLFPIQHIDNWHGMLLSKVVINAMINPLTALFRIENGQLLENPYFYRLFKQLYKEIIIVLNPEDPLIWWESVVMVCKKTANNRSSMLRDIEQSNPTEIESILGYLKTHHQKKNNLTPLIDFLYFGIKGLEK